MMGKNDRYNFDTAEDLDTNDDNEDEDVDEEEAERELEVTATNTDEDVDEDTTSTSEMTETETQTTSTETQSETNEIPHRVRYDSPKEGRDQKMFYLNDSDLDKLSELERLAESTFDEGIHTSDVRLAAFRSDLTDDGFLAEMRTIGYGYFDD